MDSSSRVGSHVLNAGRWFLSPGYSVAVLSTQSSVYFVAGAPRSNYTGRVVVYDVDGGGNVAVVQSQRGEQASTFRSRAQVLQAAVLLVGTAVSCCAVVLIIPLSCNTLWFHLNCSLPLGCFIVNCNY